MTLGLERKEAKVTGVAAAAVGGDSKLRRMLWRDLKCSAM
jgi:hypothetical protein